MSEQRLKEKERPEELIRAEKLIDDAKVNEAHELLNNFEKKEGLTLHEKVSSHLLRADLLFQQGQYRECLTLSEETYKLSLKLGKNIHSVDCLILMARSLWWLGKADEILDLITQAEELLKNILHILSLSRMKREAYFLYLKGIFHTGSQLNIDLGIKYMKQSLELGEKSNFKRLNALVLRVLAYNTALYKGDIEQGFEYITKAVQVARESNNKFTFAQCILNLGVIYEYKGDWERAINIYKECLSVYEELDNKERMGVAFNNIAYIYDDFVGDYDRAIKYIEKSLKVYSEDINYVYSGERLYEAITIALKKSDHERAKNYLHHLEQMKNQVKSKRIEIIYRISKAIILKKSSRFRDTVKAEKILKHILEEKIAFATILSQKKEENNISK